MTATNTMIAKIAAVLAVAGLVASSVVAFAPVAGAQEASTSASVTFTRDLTIGSTGADVTALQNWLIKEGYAIAAGATGYFGAQTQAALAKYQAAKGISPAAGYFGPITRASIGTGTGTGTGSDDGDSDDDGDLSGGEAELREFDLRSEESTGDEGEEGVEIASAEFEVEDGDARVERVEFTFDAASSTLDVRPWQYFDTLYITVDGDEVAEVDASDRDEWDETTNDVYVVTFTGVDVEVMDGDQASLMLVADVADSIDDLDQEFSIFVDEEGIRAVDGEGIQQYTGDESDDVDFGFGEEDNGDLQIKSNDENPDSAILVADDEDESEDYTAFVFDIENDGDAASLITDITLDVSTSSADFTDMVRTVTLVVDGDEFDGDIDETGSSATVTFEDIDVEIDSEDEMTFEVMVSLKANASSGTFSFDLANADVDAEGVDSGDESDVSGSADSDTHTVALTGIAVEGNETSETVVTPGSSADATYGTFTIKFDVTALEDDAYIATTTDNNSSGLEGAVYTIYQNGTASTSFSGASALLTSTADTTSGFFVVDEGETETFTLTVTLNPTAAGTFEVNLTNVSFNDGAEYSGETVYTIDTNNEDFQTDPTYIAS